MIALYDHNRRNGTFFPSNVCSAFVLCRYKPFDKREVYAAIGDSGNIIYVSKEKNVSVGITGTFKPRIFDRVDFIERKVLPVVEEQQ